MHVEFALTESSPVAMREIIGCISISVSTIKLANSLAVITTGVDLARMLISGGNQGEYTEK